MASRALLLPSFDIAFRDPRMRNENVSDRVLEIRLMFIATPEENTSGSFSEYRLDMFHVYVRRKGRAWRGKGPRYM